MNIVNMRTKVCATLLLALVITALCAGCSAGSAGDVSTVDVAAAADALMSADIGGAKEFAGFKSADAEYLTAVLGIDAGRLSGFAALVSASDDADPHMALLLIPKEGERDEIKSELASAMLAYQERWDNYLPEKAACVRERMTTEIGDCVVLLISSDNDAALDAVRTAAR